jgi:hypothetical protein
MTHLQPAVDSLPPLFSSLQNLDAQVMKRYQGLALGLTAYMAVSFLSAVQAAEPQFSSLKPWGFQRGTEVEVTFSGNRLSDAEEVLLYEPGVEVKSVEPVDDRRVKATFVVSDDCKLGQHAMRIRTKSGISEVQLFYIGALPEIEEVEPNNDFNEPQPIELNTTVNGVIQSEDEDYFVVEAKKGQRITAELEGLRLGRTFFDPYVAILNEKRFELAKSDDNTLVYQDCICSIICFCASPAMRHQLLQNSVTRSSWLPASLELSATTSSRLLISAAWVLERLLSSSALRTIWSCCCWNRSVCSSDVFIISVAVLMLARYRSRN